MPSRAEKMAAKVRETIDGTEKFCTGCDEWWPADSEFWWSQKVGLLGLFYCCKACYAEKDRRPGRSGAVRAQELRA